MESSVTKEAEGRAEAHPDTSNQKDKEAVGQATGWMFAGLGASSLQRGQLRRNTITNSNL